MSRWCAYGNTNPSPYSGGGLRSPTWVTLDEPCVSRAVLSGGSRGEGVLSPLAASGEKEAALIPRLVASPEQTPPPIPRLPSLILTLLLPAVYLRTAAMAGTAAQ